ncbi:MAG TPA: FAD-binding and (Fe-S)-binding domain-containing protein [Nocardioidaceae bacterium]|nr:FAD-binding and (Fe-S)-binding domain-containing protein [Nocardioidaceae bacterium]
MSDVLAALRRAEVGDVDSSSLTRALYSTDASLYRVVPQVVVRPRHVDELVAAVDVARETGTPLTMRGAGTSIAGNAVGAGIVVDTSRHLHRVLDVDADGRTATVEPGTVHAALQRAATPHGLRFGPDPSTHSRCTIGGMVGNNACGSRALGYGRTSDNVLGLDVVTGTGERLRLPVPGPSGLGADLDALVGSHLATVRTESGRFGRQVSGYSMEHLLPERGRDLARFLVGSEGTLAVVLAATVRLVEDEPHRALAVLGYPTVFEAAEAVPGLLGHPLVACEGLDSRIVDVVRATGKLLPPLPRGTGWLFAEVTGSSVAEAEAAATAVTRDAGALDAHVVTDPARQAALWRIREDGAGLAARSLGRQAQAGWEDAAVPPERLGGYLRAFDGLLRDSGLAGVPYGHFGDGCVHVRIDFPLREREGPAVYRRFVEAAADLTAAHGGSLSGEHGDGRARSELLDRMYSPEMLSLFAGVKHLFDPQDVLNPGVLVAPRPVDADLRLSARLREPRHTLRLMHDHGSLVEAVHRCTGVGRCVAAGPPAGSPAGSPAGVMCPSYLATREEKDSTRGRARVLQEMVDGRLVRDGWRSAEVHEALDLCLACRGCSSDCPTGVDMASYKAEALHQRYRRRLRPRSHYTLGRLPRWTRLAQSVAPLANAVMRLPGARRLATGAAGIDARRSVPQLTERPLRRWARGTPYDARHPDGYDVVVWADSFTDSFAAPAGRAAVSVLEAAGLRVGVLTEPVCCGLTWVSTGQLTAARRIAARAVDVLHPFVAAGVPVVGLEPSCLATMRSDAVELLADPRAEEVAAGVRSLAEVLSGVPGWEPPDLSGTEVVAQPHCHHASVIGWEADAALLARSGALVTRVGGCCGLAGNFGVERGHYEVSVKVFEHDLLPAVRAAQAAAAREPVVLADGFSCRTQLDDLAGVSAVHLAQLLAGVPGRP